jgi:GNAT superfamily N-acetyltransferase
MPKPSPSPRLRYRAGSFPAGQAGQLAALFKHTFWAAERTTAGVRRMLKHTPFSVSAWEGPKLVGYLRVLTDFTYRAALYDVVVDPAYRGRGISKEMMRRLHEHPRLRRIETWYLATRDAHGLYEQFGWFRDAKAFMKRRRTPARGEGGAVPS